MSATRTTKKTREEREAVASGPTLLRGEACLPCRRKKSRCDGSKPACKQCTKVGRADGCEYQDSRFLHAISDLEARVRSLQERIHELETPSPRQSPPGPSSIPTLPHSSAPQSALFQDGSTSAAQRTPVPPWFGATAAAGTCAISDKAAQALLNAFIPHAPLFGLPDHTLIRLPNVHPSLLESVYAVSCHFSEQPTLQFLEAKFISRAEAALAHQRYSVDTRETDIEKVQAQVVLATLLFMNQSVLRALAHAGGAMRIARFLGLQRCMMDSEPEGAATWVMVCSLELHLASAELSIAGPTSPAAPLLPPTQSQTLGYSPASDMSSLGRSSYDTGSVSSLEDVTKAFS